MNQKSRVYQKVEGQKRMLKHRRRSHRFNTYQKIEGQKPKAPLNM